MIEFVEYDRDFLQSSWAWLNDPEIRRLTDTPVFTQEQQERWFESLSSTESTYFIRGILVDGVRVGATGLKKITEADGEYWGYIGDKAYWGRGIGKQMIACILEEGARRGLQSVYLRVINENPRAIRLYEAEGFVTDEALSTPEMRFMRKRY